MNRNFAVIIISIALAAVLAASAAAGPGGQSRSPRVKSMVSVEGIITAVNEGRSSFTLRVLTPGHQRQVGASSITVQVQSGADIHFARGDDDIDRPARIREFRVGDRVHVQALRLDNGQFLATRVVVQNRGSGAGEPTTGRDTAQGQAVEFQGVVLEKGTRSLRVRQNNGNVRTVLVTSNTEITGRVDAFRDIRVGDQVDVRGTLNADGSVVARRIAVLRSTANETSISGTIVMKNSTGARFLILNSGLAVSVSENTRITSGSRTRSFDDLRTGMAITVYGSPITVSGLTVGINARLITY